MHSKEKLSKSQANTSASAVHHTRKKTLVSTGSSKNLTNSPYILPNITSQAFCCVLEDTIQQLIILGSIENLPKVKTNIIPKTLQERFDVKTDCVIFDHETLKPCELTGNKMVKLQMDRLFVEKILREAFINLASTGTYESLKTILDKYNACIVEEDELLMQDIKQQKKLEEILEITKPEKRSMMNQIEKCNIQMGQLQDELQDTIYNIKIKNTYVDQWESARREQNYLLLQHQEAYHKNLIINEQKNMHKEYRIHKEIKRFIYQLQKDQQRQIDRWQNEYDNAIELYDTKINALNIEREQQLNELAKLKKEYQKREQEIEDYLKLREQRRLDAEILQNQIKAVIKLQAWWRGTMVRKCLGPYDKKKAKQREKASGKKKGKK